MKTDHFALLMKTDLGACDINNGGLLNVSDSIGDIGEHWHHIDHTQISPAASTKP
jgi:hypothetical protein